jgi:hypothetical protein
VSEENNLKHLKHLVENLERVGGVSLLLAGIPCKMLNMYT